MPRPAGINGFNVTDYGLSRENVIARMRTLGGGFALVRNSPTLCAWASDLGARVVYRETNDDPAAHPLNQDPAEFVQKRASAAPDAAYIHLTNELDPPYPELHVWTKQALEYADRIGRKVCIYNCGTHKSTEDWLEGRDNLVYAARHGHAIGAHFYSDGQHDNGGLAFLQVREQIGGLWLLTEFGYIRSIFDANKGWRGAISEGAYQQFAQRWTQYFGLRNIPLLWFSYEHWPNNDEGRASGFGLMDSAGMLTQLGTLNLTYTFKEVSMPDTTPVWQAHFAKPNGNYTVNIRAAADTNAAKVGLLPVAGSTVELDTSDAGNWRRIRVDGAVGFVSAAYVTFTPSVEPEPEPEPEIPDPGTLYSVFLTEDELRQVAAKEEAIAALYRQLVEQYATLADEHAAIAAVYRAAAERSIEIPVEPLVAAA